MNKALYFLLGLGIGAAGSYFYLKSKFERYAQEEIDSVKEMYKAQKTETEEPEEEESFEKVSSIAERIKKNNGYVDYSTKVERPADPMHKPFSEEPEIITEDEFGELDEYEKVTLSYYSDGILADDLSDEIVEDAESKVGKDYITKLIDDEEDIVFVRNDIEKIYYEIVKNLQTYKEVTGNDPSPAETEE